MSGLIFLFQVLCKTVVSKIAFALNVTDEQTFIICTLLTLLNVFLIISLSDFFAWQVMDKISG